MNRLIQSKLIDERREAGEITKIEAAKLHEKLWNTKPPGSILAKLIGFSSAEVRYFFAMLFEALNESREEERK